MVGIVVDWFGGAVCCSAVAGLGMTGISTSASISMSTHIRSRRSIAFSLLRLGVFLSRLIVFPTMGLRIGVCPGLPELAELAGLVPGRTSTLKLKLIPDNDVDTTGL